MIQTGAKAASFSKSLYFDSLPKVVDIYVYWFWPAICFLFLVVCIGFYSSTDEQRYLTTCIPLVVVIGVIPTVIRLAYAELLELAEQAPTFIVAPSSEVSAWFADELKVFADHRRMHLIALVSFLSVAAAYEKASVFEAFQSYGYGFAIFLAGLAGLFTAVAIFHLFLLARVIWRAGRFKVLVEPYSCGLLSIGSFMFKYWVISALLWAFCLSSWITTPGVRLLSFLIAIPSSTFIVASFVISMVPLHRQMVRFKQWKINEIKARLSELLDPRYEKLSADDRETVKFLEDRALRVDLLPEWPFRPSSLIGVALSSLLTFVPSLTKLFANTPAM